MPGAQTIALRPLSDAHATALTAQLVGTDPPLDDWPRGWPNGQEEIRSSPKRWCAIWRSAACLHGHPGAYSLRGDADDADVPATLHATIGARIDRLEPDAKRTLNAAALIGSRFDVDLLASLVDDAGCSTADRCRTDRSGRDSGRSPSLRFVIPSSGRLPTSHSSNPTAHSYIGGWRSHRRARSRLSRRQRGIDCRAFRSSGRFRRCLRVAHARRDLGQLPRQQCGCHDQLAQSTAGR